MKLASAITLAAALLTVPSLCYAAVPAVPVPEPSTTLLVVIGVGAAVFRKLHRAE